MKQPYNWTHRLLAFTSLLIICTMLFAACNTGAYIPSDTSNATEETSPINKETDVDHNHTEAHIHSFGDWSVTTEPSCSEKGERKRVCICGAVEVQDVATVGHTYTSVVTEPTCTEAGYTTHTCHCGYTYTDSYVNSIGHHTYGYWQTLRAPTCTEDGEEVRVCNQCQRESSRIIQAKGHTFGEWKTTIEPTCTEKGELQRECACGETETESILAKGHRYNYVVSAPATCTDSGELKLECNCGKIEVVPIPATGHSHIATITAPTCTERGYTTYRCTCGDVYVDNYVKANGHTEVIDKAVAPTCTETGLTEGKHCSVCNTVLLAQTEVPVIAHTYDDKYDENCNVCGFVRDAKCAHINTTVITGKAPTCTESGLTDGSKCTKCGEILVEQEVIEANGHTEVIDKAVPPTCTETGLTEGKHCSVCNTVLLAQAEVPMIAHTYDDKYDENCNECGFVRDAECAHTNTTVILGKAPTCTESGLTDGSKCTKCGEILVEQEVIMANGHTEVIDKAVSPTCTETGLTEGKHCSVCNTILVAQEVIEANGHTEVIDKAVDPTCTETGLTEGKHCSVCNTVLIPQEEIPVIAHTYDDKYDENCNVCGFVRDAECAHINTTVITGKAPTCTEAGLTDGSKCTKCGEILVEQEVIKANGHNYSSIVTSPTCNEKGYTTHTCYCGNSYTDNYTSPQHNDEDNNSVCDACKQLLPGLYDANDNLLVSWDELVNEYGMDAEKDYDGNTYNTAPTSPHYILTNTAKFQDGVKLVIGNIEKIGNCAFENCINLTSVTIPPSVKSIGDWSFYRCDKLADITLSEGITSIGNSAFSICNSITSINIPNGVTSISNWAFADCSNLARVTISRSVTSINEHAFAMCINLASIIVENGNPVYYSQDNCVIEKSTNTLIVGCTNSVIPNSVTTIGNSAFSRLSTLKSIIIPHTVKTIGHYAFEGCSNLKAVYYTGTYKQWIEVNIGADNSPFTSADVYLYSESKPTKEGNYWHYVNSVPTIWHEHVYTSIIAEPTCTEMGYTTYICDCGSSYVDNYISATGHTEVIDNAVAPTCTETGLTEGKHCSVCNTVLLAQAEVPMIAHTYDDKYDETCNECGFIREAECAHTNTTVILGKAPTCMEYGLTDGSKCTKCGEILVEQDVIEANGHTEVIDKAVAPTCTEAGLTEGKHCSVCNTVLVAQEVIKANGHTEVIDKAVAPTCTETGLTEGKHCSVCKTVLIAQEEIPVLAHTYDDKYDENCNVCGFVRNAECAHTNTTLIAGKAPTCTESGLTDGSKCTKCGEILVEQELIKANGHTEVIDKAVAPTCTETGLTEGKHCSVCSTVLVAQEVVKANGHTEVIDKAVAPTCTETGLTEGKHCSVCNTVLVAQEVIKANGHSYTSVVTAPTATENGYTTYSCNCGDSYTETIFPTDFTITSENRAMIGYTGEANENLVIPAVFENNGVWYRVTAIGEGAFENCSNLISITIPETITTIGNDAFYGCTSLVNLYISDLSSWCNIEFQYDSEYEDGVTDYYCSSNPIYYADNLYVNSVLVTDLVIPEGVSEIPAFAFYGVKATSLSFPSTLKSIGIGAFKDAKIGTELVLNEGITNIGAEAFRHCSTLNSVSLPTTLTAIGDNAFRDCSQIKAVYISDLSAWCNISFAYDSDWDEGLWLGCWSNPLQYAHNLYLNGELITDLVIPNNVMLLKPFAFDGGHFTSVNFHDGITSIPSGAFRNCTKLTEIILPDSITSIGDYSFNYCSSVKIAIFNNVTSIGYSSVWGMSSIDAIYFKSKPSGINTEPNYYYEDDIVCGYVCVKVDGAIYGIKDGVATLLHASSDITGDFEIPTSIEYSGTTYSVTSIGKLAFENMDSITSIKIPNSVITIGNSAFNSCDSLESVEISSLLTSIGDQAFSGCKALVTINYNGTKEQWNTISKVWSWDFATGKYTIYCSNGFICKIHTEVIDKAIAPTCTETGLTEGKHCSECNTVLVPQEIVNANGHTEVINKAVAPTCTETGLTEGKHCSVCNTIIVAQETVKANGHTEVIDKAVAPTCTETGLTEGKHCLICNVILVKQEVIPALLGVTINCPEGLTVSNLAPSYSAGETVSLTVTVADNYRFEGWYVNGVKKSSELEYSFNMPDSSVSITLKVSSFFDPSSKRTANQWNGSIASGFAGGSGTKDDPYLISTGAQLAYMAQCINNNKYMWSFFRLTNSINLNGREWMPIGNNSTSSGSYYNSAFRGGFDGNGYIIYNFKLTKAQSNSSAYYGLFGYLYGASINNLAIEDFSINIAQSASIYAGGLAGWASDNAKITNCYAKGSINVSAERSSSYGSNDAYSGGLIGKCHRVAVNNCYADVDIYSDSANSAAYAGGLVGWYGYSDILNSYAVGDVESTFYAGGLVAYSYDASITNSYASGNVIISKNSMSIYPGGLIGKAEITTIANCYATGNVTSGYWAGGLICYTDIECIISNSYATGNVYAEEDAGGLIAYSYAKIDNCYATGNVEGGYWCGGFIGRNDAPVTISNCYSTGDVTYHSYNSAGAFIGFNNSGDITNCYATGNISCTTSCDFNRINIGGFVGETYRGNIKNCYATGNITVNHASSTPYLYIGGFVAENDGSNISNCYRYQSQTVTSNISYTSNTVGTKCTLNQINNQTFYTTTLKWNTDIWVLDNLDFNNKLTPCLAYK